MSAKRTDLRRSAARQEDRLKEAKPTYPHFYPTLQVAAFIGVWLSDSVWAVLIAAACAAVGLYCSLDPSLRLYGAPAFLARLLIYLGLAAALSLVLVMLGGPRRDVGTQDYIGVYIWLTFWPAVLSLSAGLSLRSWAARNDLALEASEDGPAADDGGSSDGIMQERS
jgi:hypothetical protein